MRFHARPIEDPCVQDFRNPNKVEPLTTTDEILGVRILGFKPVRYGEWIRAILDSAGRGGIWRAVVKMGRSIWTGKVDRKTWRERMKICGRCPIRTGHVCEVVDGERVFGCGCFVPFKALVRAPYLGGCWAKKHAPESGLGWK